MGNYLRKAFNGLLLSFYLMYNTPIKQCRKSNSLKSSSEISRMDLSGENQVSVLKLSVKKLHQF